MRDINKHYTEDAHGPDGGGVVIAGMFAIAIVLMVIAWCLVRNGYFFDPMTQQINELEKRIQILEGK